MGQAKKVYQRPGVNRLEMDFGEGKGINRATFWGEPCGFPQQQSLRQEHRWRCFTKEVTPGKQQGQSEESELGI